MTPWRAATISKAAPGPCRWQTTPAAVPCSARSVRWLIQAGRSAKRQRGAGGAASPLKAGERVGLVVSQRRKVGHGGPQEGRGVQGALSALTVSCQAMLSGSHLAIRTACASVTPRMARGSANRVSRRSAFSRFLKRRKLLVDGCSGERSKRVC